ncbi:MAG: hypothetical protein ABW034_06050 [Steroidobacteraceae bacterium]
MINAKSTAGIAASAALFALSAVAMTAPASAADSDAVHCYGVNNCKGMSDCKTTSNECKGQNSCKGHGFKEMSAKACTAAGGRTTEAK